MTYCSEHCQRAHWKEHKKLCNKGRAVLARPPPPPPLPLPPPPPPPPPIVGTLLHGSARRRFSTRFGKRECTVCVLALSQLKRALVCGVPSRYLADSAGASFRATTRVALDRAFRSAEREREREREERKREGKIERERENPTRHKKREGVCEE